jgi:hypothetical protein
MRLKDAAQIGAVVLVANLIGMRHLELLVASGKPRGLAWQDDRRARPDRAVRVPAMIPPLSASP